MQIQTRQDKNINSIIEHFQQRYPEGFYYLETIEKVELNKVQTLEVPEQFFLLRLFHPRAEIVIRNLTRGQLIVEISDEATGEKLHYEQSRSVFLAGAYAKNTLTIDILSHPKLGYFECWKEVV